MAERMVSVRKNHRPYNHRPVGVKVGRHGKVLFIVNGQFVRDREAVLQALGRKV